LVGAFFYRYPKEGYDGFTGERSGRDRLRSEQDYQVNLKAELEIRHLHEKLDVLLKHQWQKLLEVQQIQMDLMKELVDSKSS